MKIKFIFLFLAAITCTNLYAQTKPGYPFHKEITAFKHQDSLNFPKPNGVLFIGASSIQLWDDLQQRFAGVPIIQRGISGSELWQWADYFIPAIVVPYHPRKIFLYAGENDIAVSNKKAPQVFASFKKFYNILKQQLPDAELYYLSIKSSPKRIKFAAEFARFDKQVKTYLVGKPNCTYVDLSAPVLNANMAPDSTLFKKDMLHLNSKGYDKWQAVLDHYIK